MKENIKKSQEKKEGIKINRNEALKKLGKYGKYTALTAIGTFLMLNPQESQAQSSPGGSGFD